MFSCRPLAVVLLLSLMAIGIDDASAADQFADIISKNDSRTGKYRVVWISDPTTTATIAWDQKQGEPGRVHIGTSDHRRHADKYSTVIKPHRVQDYDDMTNCFVRLENLDPDTEYFFCVVDQFGVGPRLKFRTAPADPKPFTFIAGGDSRNYRDVRQSANELCEKLQPLFVAFTGDMINRDEAQEWDDWLEDWQLTISKDGHVIPIVPHRGNHERRPQTIHNLFDTPPDVYFAFSIGGKMFRYYALNSEIPAAGPQEKWLEEDLSQHGQDIVHLVSGYHKPMRPHVSKKGEGTNPLQWADNFYAHGFDLAIESDSHVMKRTVPLKPDANGSESFSAAPNDPKATVYIGEGCWGAPLRPADDAKPWTLDTASFNGFDWISVSPDEIQIRTVRIEDVPKVGRVEEMNSFEPPTGLKVWEAKGGVLLTIPADQ